MESATLPRAKKPKASPLSTADIKVDQPSPIGMPLEAPFVHPDPKIVLPEHPGMTKDYLDELAFNEEPMTIRMLPSSDENAETRIPCTIQGKGIEVFLEGMGWREFKALDVGVQYVTKRKYVEVFARAKHTSVRTSVTGNLHLNEEPVNTLVPSTRVKYPFEVILDANPRGRAWLQKLVSAPG